MEWIDGLFAFDLQAFVSAIIIDLVMSGDNAIIIGLATALEPPAPDRRRQEIEHDRERDDGGEAEFYGEERRACSWFPNRLQGRIVAA